MGKRAFANHPFRTRFFVLNANGSVSQVDNPLDWAEAFEKTDRQIALGKAADGSIVSTAFLGLAFGERNDVFETAVFDGDEIKHIARTDSIERAREMHRSLINMFSGAGDEKET